MKKSPVRQNRSKLLEKVKKGRPDGWLYVGGTKAGPAVLWLYPFGGAPNGHDAGFQLDPARAPGKASRGLKIVMECRKSPAFPGLRKISACLVKPGWGQGFCRTERGLMLMGEERFAAGKRNGFGTLPLPKDHFAR